MRGVIVLREAGTARKSLYGISVFLENADPACVMIDDKKRPLPSPVCRPPLPPVPPPFRRGVPRMGNERGAHERSNPAHATGGGPTTPPRLADVNVNERAGPLFSGG